MLYIASKESIDAYYQSDRLNQSSLKELEKGLDSFKDWQEACKNNTSIPDYFLLGKVVDTILTGDYGEYDNTFIAMRNKPSEKVCEIIEYVFKKNQENPVTELKDYEGDILEAVNKYEYYPKWKDETRIANILKSEEYFEFLKESQGKIIIPQEIEEKGIAIANSLKTNERTKVFFNRKHFEDSGVVDIYYQFPIYFEMEGVECKALLDILIVYHNEDGTKKYQPMDLKTTSNYTIDFGKSAQSFRYDYQAAFYIEAVKSHFKCEYEDIEPFIFIVESTKKVGNPLLFRTTEDWLLNGLYGLENPYRGFKGVLNLVKEYKELMEDGFKEDLIIKENKGILSLK